MKRYVFEEYRDSRSTGTEKIFDNEEQAKNYAVQEWKNLSEYDKTSYIKDSVGKFFVYEIEISKEQLNQYNDGELDIALSELWTRDVLDVMRLAQQQ